MAIKEITPYADYSTEDLERSNPGTKIHVPQFFLLRKWPTGESADSSRHFHPYSPEAPLAAATECEDKDMEKWTPSSADGEMAGDATPNYGKGTRNR